MSSLLADIEDTFEMGECVPTLYKIFDKRIELCKHDIDVQLYKRMTEFTGYYRLSETDAVKAILDSTLRWNKIECVGCNIYDLYKTYDLTSKEISMLFGTYILDRYNPCIIARIEGSDDPNDMIVVNFQNSLKWMDEDEDFKRFVIRILYKIGGGTATMYNVDSSLRSYGLVFTETFLKMMNSYIEPELKKYCHLD